MTHLPIDLFFSYISIPAAILVALVLWGAWKLTEPDKEIRRERAKISAMDLVGQRKG